ncbi:MAG: DUF4118 domain-containing protein [Eubacteriales bacterium]
MASNRIRANYNKTIQYILILLCCIAASTGVGWLFRYLNFPKTNIVVVYILSVLLTARFTKGYIYGIVASIIATGTFNYFFTQPYYTFSVNDPTYLITFAIMTLTAIITSTLTSKVKQNALEAEQKEAEASALYRLTNRLTDAKDISDIASIAVNTISDILGCRAACLCFDRDGEPEHNFIQQQDSKRQIHRRVDDAAALKRSMETLRTDYEADHEFYDWPIYGREAILGVLRIPKKTAANMTAMQNRLLHSMLESMALAMDRFRSAQQRAESNEEALKERYRSNLLRAISHDLRTPLSGIMGTAEMLMDMTKRKDERYELAEGIYKDADWLHSLVENILNLTRLQEGRLVLDKQLEAIEEVVGVAVAAIAKRTPGREITVQIPDEVLLVPMDARLIEQTLVNLLDNAVKNTPPDKEISICVKEDKEHAVAVFSVMDFGSGISEVDLPHIFQMFYTRHGRRADAQYGVGLGLAICESIVSAHGGNIKAQNRSDGQGAEFVFTLPMKGESDGEQK